MFSAFCGRDALEVIEKHKIDLILLDIIMPEMDGFEVCKRIKAHEEYKDTPIIFLTSNTDEKSIETAFDIGGIDYIVKPFLPKEFFSRIKTHLTL